MRRFVTVLTALSLTAVGGAWSATTASARSLPPIKHVFVVVLENKGFDETFGPGSQAPYLAQTLRSQGQLLTQYYATGHASLNNYISMVSGQAANPATQAADCLLYTDVTPGIVVGGQAVGVGCVYPTEVKTLADQLEASRRTWRGYMEDMGNDPVRDGGTTCAHPTLNMLDTSGLAAENDQYSSRHNPFVFFHSIIDRPTCDANVVPLTQMATDLAHENTTPNFAFITPNLCNDGHDPFLPGSTTCTGVNANGTKEGGLVAINYWLQRYVPTILSSPAWVEGNSMLIVTFDEAEPPDFTACPSPCASPAGPGTPLPGIGGPGGGRVGAVVLSPFTTPGSTTDTPYNHYSFLRSMEDLFGLGHLGYAAVTNSFGREDVFDGF